ncbi:MAG: tetratricopeptide repeat protein [Verrucomicrobiia bacterium]
MAKKKFQPNKNKENLRETSDESVNLYSIKGPKKALFLAILVLLPLFILFVAEMGLRIIDYGYPTSFLIKKDINGRQYYIENQEFGYRFFPKSMARTPEPLLCSVVKPTNTYRIVVFGESAALGDPAPEFGFSRMLETILRTSRKDINFEVINVSMTAINSFVIEEIARDCKKLNADEWIIYAGNNEVIGPFSPGTVFGPRVLPRPLIKFLIWFKSLRISQLIGALVEKISPESISEKEWGGMEMFLKNQIPFNTPTLNRVYNNFEQNLINIIQIGRRSGVNVILTRVIANYRDCAPFSSLNKRLTDLDKQRWEVLYKEGIQGEENKNFPKAIELYKKALSIDDTYAEANFRIAKCIEGMQQNATELANNYYQKGLDYDTLRFRPDSEIIAAIESVAKRFGSDICYIDPVRELYQKSSIKLPGRDLLWEHVHLNFEGNYKLALLFAREVLKNVDKKYGFRSGIEFKPVSKEIVYSALGLTDWDRLEVGNEMRKRLQLPPFINRCNQKEEMAYLDNLVAGWEMSVKTNSIEKYIHIHKESVDSRPDDWVLRKKYAEILEYANDYQLALEQWSAITNLLPHWGESYYRIGNLLDQTGRSSEAIDYFKTALTRNPNSVEALSGLGLCLLNLKQYQEAIDALKSAVKIKPNFAAAYVNLSLAYANMGRIEEAKQQCYLALKSRTNYAPAFINLGKIYASEGNYELALTNYIQASIAEPNNSVVFYNLGNGYARLGRHNEAITNYLKAIELKPNFGEAILNLAVELSTIGRTGDAYEKFESAVKLMPENPDAVFNYGIACARLGDYKKALLYLEKSATLTPQNPNVYFNIGLVYLKTGAKDKAVEAFKTVLNIDPNNEAAKRQLSRLMNIQ